MRIGLIGVGRIGVFHASTLRGLPGVDSLIITDADLERARQVAGEFGAQTAESVAELLGMGVDALVIAAPTGTHPELIKRGVQAGVPVFCEKPVAPDVEGTLDVIKSTSGSAVPVQIGFQRRFDEGFRAAREAAQSGSLGWVSGREVAAVYATGANRGEEFFRAADDVDTASATLRMDDGTLAVVSCGRYNDAGYDVRLELLGSAGSVCAGLDDRMALRSAEPDQSFPAGPAHRDFIGRFGDAYAAELAAFIGVAAGQTASPCTLEDALEAFYVAEACELSRHRGQPVLVEEVRQ